MQGLQNLLLISIIHIAFFQDVVLQARKTVPIRFKCRMTMYVSKWCHG